MASGKQLSFSFGEISPSLRFRSNAVSYSSGLSKLRNMYTRRQGGVSNRPGLEFVKISEFQQDIPVEGGDAGIRGFTFWDANSKEWRIYEYGKTYNPAKDRLEYGFLVTSPTVSPFNIFAGSSGSDSQFLKPLPKDIQLTAFKNGIAVAPMSEVLVKPDEFTPAYSQFFNFILKDNTLVQRVVSYPQTFQFGFSIVAANSVAFGTGAISIPATYLFTGINNDEVETYIHRIDYVPSTPFSLYVPNSQVLSFFKFNLTSPSGLKKVKLYRAAYNENDTTPFYKFVGQIMVNDNQTQYSFTDFGAEDVSQTPPSDASIFNYDYQGLGGVNTFANYQQRLIAVLEPNTTKTIKSGDMVASKLGAPLQFSFPLIFTNTGAFQFSVPITDGSPVVALLAMERLIAFTERGVYAIRGGEQGVLTPTSVNPFLISEEGCSKTVQPKMAGSRGYFLNNTHTKLMCIMFGDDGNLRVFEVSTFSDHLLFEDITQLEVLSSGDDAVYLLRKDGKLVQVTPTDDGSHGFSLIETDGYVESIFRGKAKRAYTKRNTPAESPIFYDVLMCHIIRNGVRTLERLNFRDDANREGENFADCSSTFGVKLSDGGINGYVKSGSYVASLYSGYKVNIKSITNYNAGSIVELHWNLPDSPILPIGKRLHFFYESQGVVQYVRAVCTDDSDVSTGDPDFPVKSFAYFESDVPEELQDVRSQSLSNLEKIKRMTRFLPAFKSISLGNIAVFSNGADEYPVSVFADGEVLSSPLNPNMPTIYATKNALDPDIYDIEFPDYVSYGYAGLPYQSEFETLDLEAEGNRTLTDTRKIINSVGLGLMETRGGFAGMPEQTLQNMEPIVTRQDESLNVQTPNFNGHIVVHVPAEYSEPGRVNIKHVDPSPISILSVYPKGLAGD